MVSVLGIVELFVWNCLCGIVELFVWNCGIVCVELFVWNCGIVCVELFVWNCGIVCVELNTYIILCFYLQSFGSDKKGGDVQNCDQEFDKRRCWTVVCWSKMINF
jgi:hypothetical protein